MVRRRKPRKPNPQHAAIAKDWASQPPAEQKRFANEFLRNYFNLARPTFRS